MRDGKCRFNFPHGFQAETVIASNKRPQYARPDDGRTFQRPGKDYTFTNRDVATYNAYLSVRFNAHINVESCAGYGSVKYAFKYVYKGPDYATVALQADLPPGAAPPRVDEIQDYIDARYVAAHEALWRISEFRTHGRSVPVLALAIHLEDQQFVTIRSEQQLDARLAQEAIQKTTLTEFFAENSRSRTQLLYQDFPAAYTWSKQRKRWRPRKKGFCIGRVIYLPIAVGEAYYLRLLLVSVPGQTSFEDARTFEGTLHPTFQAACLARGLLLNDGEYVAALEEAARFQLGRQLRELFVTILASCRPADPSALWQRFQEQLADDCPHQLRTLYLVPEPTSNQARDLALCLIRSSLASRNMTLRSCGLPEPDRDWIEEFSTHSNRLLREQLAFNPEDLQAEVAAGAPHMNTEQRLIHTTLCSAVDAGGGGLFFVDGPGGTGKTFVQNITLAQQRLQNRVALAVASSGIAATLLAGGTTAHSRFKIPVDVHEDSTCSIPKNSHLADLLRETRLIFWDEAVMCHRHAMEAVSRTLQDLRGEDDPRRELPFGGIVVCFCGDFRQTLPVVKKGTRGQIVSATLKRSPLWRNVHVFKLTQNMRLLRPGLAPGERREIAAFAEQLLRVGERVDADGRIQWDTRDMALGNSIEALAAEVFPGVSRRLLPPDVLRDSAILAPKNDVANKVNALLLRSMPGQESVSYSVDFCKDMDNASNFPIEFLHTIDLAALPPHELRLKPGCPVMLLRNLDPSNGLCNGTRLIVIAASRKLLRCSILGTRRHGEIVQLPRIPLDTPSVDAGVEFTRQQFPVKLSFAMTINKAQGQSLSTVGLLLDPEVFSHGQLYVALSRVTRPDGIRMVLPDVDTARAGRLKNVVYTEVL
jgi:PIF1-like helicase/Helicase